GGNGGGPEGPALLGLFRAQGQWGLGALEASSGMFLFWEESDEALGEALERIAPSEIVTSKSLTDSPLIAGYGEARSAAVVTRFDDWQAVYDDSVAYIKAFFGLDSLRALELDTATTSAVALVLRFLQSHLQAALPHITLPRRQQAGTAMLLGPVVERSLELFRPANPDYRGKTLLDILDETLTPMGGRLLRRWVRSPLLSLPAIVERHESVGELVEHPTLLETLRTALAPLRDLERLAARFSCQVATPKDAAALRDSLTQVPELLHALAGVGTSLLIAQREHLTADLSELCTTLRQALVDVPPLHVREGGVFASGYHAELDRLRSAASDAKQWLAALQAREISRTGISSLKVGYNRVFGYY